MLGVADRIDDSSNLPSDHINTSQSRNSAFEFRPYIPGTVRLPEFTPRAIVLGVMLGLLFGISSLYLVLRVGITVSASIPIAFISITLFRLCSKFGLRDATILENNIVQTAGSSGEAIAFGIAVTMPALMVLGFDLQTFRVVLVAIFGASLGVLLMIPLRRSLIVERHGFFKYPEGTACAEVLKAGDQGESKLAGWSETDISVMDEAARGSKVIFTGFGVGLAYYTLMTVFKTWREDSTKIFGRPLEGSLLSLENNPALLGVGYIIGPHVAGVMFAGGLLASLFFIPAIKYFGGYVVPLAPESAFVIRDMSPFQIQRSYVIYIAAGAVTMGALFSLWRTLPSFWNGLRGALADVAQRRDPTGDYRLRTDQDLNTKFVIVTLCVLFVSLLLFRVLHLNLLAALTIFFLGALYVTVSARLTGQVGSSSTPISGITVSALLLTCLVFFVVGWTGPIYYVTALSVGAIICVASSNSSTASQVLKTGFLIGATPKYQQVAMLIGAVGAAIVLGPLLVALNTQETIYVPRIGFEEVSRASLKTQQIQELKPYTQKSSPPIAGSYRILEVDAEKRVEQSEIISLDDTPPSKTSYLVDETSGKVCYLIRNWIPDRLRVRRTADEALADQDSPPEKVGGTFAALDHNVYEVWHKHDSVDGPAGKYLVDGDIPMYFVDPGINGIYDTAPDRSKFEKFYAPKSFLMAYIIKGILNRQLPWNLILIGAMLTVVLELCGIPSLAFAVGLYLPVSSSAPIFIGGLIRSLIDRGRRHSAPSLEDEAAIAEDKAPGTLLAAGYVAGAALSGVAVAVTGFWAAPFAGIEKLSQLHNPFYEGPYSDLLSLIPFLCLGLLLYFVASGRLLRSPSRVKR